MFFDERMDFRIQEDYVKLMHKIVKKDCEKYDNESHFVRCAVIKLLREERKRLKL